MRASVLTDDAPLERVWEALIDVERVAPCLPGAQITEAGEDGTYQIADAPEGPLLVELHTGLADKTPMTDRGGQPFHQQVESLKQKLHKAG